MKRLIAVAVLLAFVIATIIISFIVTNDFYSEMESRLTECEQTYKSGDKKTAAEMAAVLEEYCHEKEAVLILFLNRALIDEVAESATRLVSYAQTQNDDMFLCESELCLHLITDMRRTDKYLIY